MSIAKEFTLEEEMKKNPQLELSDIQSLKEWCEKQPHLPKVEDNFLALFLHTNNYRVEPTKSTIENYYTIRTHIPEFFCDRDPVGNKELRQIFKVVGTVFLNGETKEGYKILYEALLEDDPACYNFNSNVKCCTMLYDFSCLTYGTTNGIIYVADFKKTTFGHVSRMNPLGLRKILYYIQETIPTYIKGIHMINAPSAMKNLMNIIRPFLKKELIDMIHFHSSLESVSEYVSVDLLPNEIGGKAGSIHELTEIQVKKLEDYREWFLLDETTRRVNEALRIGKSMSANDLFGVEGSFKKLDID